MAPAAGETCSPRALLTRGLALQEKLRSWGGPGSARLLKIVRGELAFVNRLAGLPILPRSCPELRSSNFDHLEAVFSILQNPLVSGVSAVMQSFAVTAMGDSAEEMDLDEPGGGLVAHVDIVCMLQGRPVWLVVSTRNPWYIMWTDSDKLVKGLRSRLVILLKAACADAVTQPASILLCFSGELVDEVDRGLKIEFGAIRSFALGEDRVTPAEMSVLESSIVVLNPREISQQDEDCNFSEVEGGEWLDVELNHDAKAAAEKTTFPTWVTYEVNVVRFNEVHQGVTKLSGSCCELDPTDAADTLEEKENLISSVHEAVLPVLTRSLEETEFDENHHSSKVIQQKLESTKDGLSQTAAVDQGLINLDTTALIALVSEVSNGGAQYLLSLADEEMERRFSSMTAFLREQALSELNRPLVKEIEAAIGSRQPVISQYVHDEFNSIVFLIGGTKERERATSLLQRLRVVPNTPTERVMALPLTGKIKTRHKLVFGTGDQLNVPTLTANMAFVRAAKQKDTSDNDRAANMAFVRVAKQEGVAIEVVEHRPHALTGD
ncbi:hypothetical protein R1flu_014626 [Riccia fluitans]|uniref:DUF1308 domain-containing protein n=1 Tax=Riccia fluitans TaxID=41844 RepID=A0ABD1YH02_9MARC